MAGEAVCESSLSYCTFWGPPTANVLKRPRVEEPTSGLIRSANGTSGSTEGGSAGETGTSGRSTRRVGGSLPTQLEGAISDS